MAKDNPKKRKDRTRRPGEKSFLAAIGEYAAAEWDQIKPLEPGTTQEHAFIAGYIFGASCGLALSSNMPEMVEFTRDNFAQRGWLVNGRPKLPSEVAKENGHGPVVRPGDELRYQ